MSDSPDVLLRVPTDLRDDLKEPLGPIHDAIPLDELSGTVVTVGDVVSHDCDDAGRAPDIALIDGRTKRTAVDPDIEAALAAPDRVRIDANNPAGTITRSLLEALVEAFDREEPVQIVVEGEEDLATLPAVLAAPAGAHILYGQPDEGVVHVEVDDTTRDRVRDLLMDMDGDFEAVRAILQP